MTDRPRGEDHGPHLGGCLCGAVRFRVDGGLRSVVYCHCGQCRRQSGLYFAATDAFVRDVTIEGEDALRWYAASAEAKRGFCGTCGSALFWRREGAETISILAGAFDDGTPLVADRHIYVDDKPAWYGLHDGLPQHALTD